VIIREKEVMASLQVEAEFDGADVSRETPEKFARNLQKHEKFPFSVR
jgi:hypothetical protein